jgi:HTH-type transcriptional regulator/antitoxin HigA
MQSLMDELLMEVGDDENHPLADMLDVVGVLVSQYEDENTLGLEPANPRDVLKFLMEQHGLKQSDLRKEIGTEGVVSEVLSGERKPNARQAKALAQRFGVSLTGFL